MSPEDRQQIAEGQANLWAAHTSFMVQIMLALQTEGVLSEAAIERILQRLDADTDHLHGEEERSNAIQSVATVRTLLAQWRATGGSPQ